MRAGFLIDRWRPGRGGAEKALALLAAHLEKRGWEVHAFGSLGPRPGEEAPGVFHPVRVFRPTRAGFEAALGEALVREARAFRCDVTVGVRHLPEVGLLWTQNGILRGEYEGRRVRGRRKVFLRFEEALLREGGARRVAAVSRLVLEEIRRFYPSARNRTVLVPNGVDLERFHPALREREGARLREALQVPRGIPLLTFPGRDPERKGLPLLLSALARLQDLPWVLLAAGPKRPARWARAARREGIPDERIRVLPHVEGPALAAAADLCVLPTRRDPCGLVVLEALACGTPVVTTSRAGAAEVLEGRPSCGTVLEDPEEEKALEEALGKWIAFLARRAPDREEIRSALSGRDQDAWMEAMEGLLREAAQGE